MEKVDNKEEAITETPQNTTSEQRQEQERTRIKKDVFIGFFKRTLGSIKATCEKTGIDRHTYYDWIKLDSEFALRVKQSWQEKLEDVEQIENNLILAGNPAMVRHFLDRRHPDFKPRTTMEVVKGDRTLEDLLTEDEDAINKKKHATDDAITKDTQDQPGADRAVVQDKEQAQGAGAVPVQQIPATLRPAQDAEKPDSQGAPQGTV